VNRNSRIPTHESRVTADGSRLRDAVVQVLAEAKKSGATAAEAGVNISQGLSVTVRLGEVETVEHTRDKGMGVTVYFGQRTGSASTTDFSEQALRETVRAACTIAKYTAEDDCAGLADPERLAKAIPDLDLHHPWNPGMEQAIELARAAESAARGLDTRIANSEGGSLSMHEGLEGTKKLVMTTIVGLSLMAALTVGCGTVTGAAVGAGSGAAIAAGTGHDPGKGALIGAGVGAAAGTIYDIAR